MTRCTAIIDTSLSLFHPLFPFIIIPFLGFMNQDVSLGVRATHRTTVQLGILPEA